MKKRPALLSAIGFTFVLLAILGISLTAQAAPDIIASQAPNASALRISQIFGAGGNSGAPYRYDFVELFNAGATAVDISSWSLQYGSQTGVLGGSTGANIYAFPVSTTIPAGRYLLVQLAGGTNGATFTADLSTTLINMSGASGKIALANVTTWLNCGGVGNLCTLPDPRIVDLVAYGNITTTAEITSVNYPTGLTNVQGALRLGNGCQDTDNNFNDFSVVVSPTLSPRNSTSPAYSCAGPQPDLVLTKSGPALANAGETITYTIHLSNTGTTTATMSLVTDTLPAAVTFVTYTTALPVNFSQPDAQTLVWDLGDVANGSSGTILVEGTVSTGVSAGIVFTNTVTASTTATETQLANNTASAATLIPVADLAVLKTGPASATAGATITYTISLFNAGTAAAPQTLITDTLPAEITFVTYTTALPANFSQPAVDTLVWDLGSLAPGANGTIQVLVSISPTLSAGTQFTNTVTASTSAVENNTANNSAQATTLIGAPDLAVVKTGPASVNVGAPIAFTLTYSNAGNLDATGVMLVDQLPAAMTYVTDSLGTGVQAGGTITWTIGALASGASGSVVLTATATTIGDWPNVAVISGGPVDSDPLNNISIVTTTLLGVDPFVLKSGPAQMLGGDVVSYTITYGNLGNSPSAVTITDTLPISFTVIGDTSGLPAVDSGNTRSWTTTIPANTTGISFTLALQAPTTVASGTQVTNTVEIATMTAGDNPNNNVATASGFLQQVVPIATMRAGTIGQVFVVTGTVTLEPGVFTYNGQSRYMYIQDETGGTLVYRGGGLNPVARGHVVRIIGARDEYRSENEFVPANATDVTDLGLGAPLSPLMTNTGSIDESVEGELVQISGQITGKPASYRLQVNDGSGMVEVNRYFNLGVITDVNYIDFTPFGVGDYVRVVGVTRGYTESFGFTREVLPRGPIDIAEYPRVLGISPANNAPGVAVTTPITAAFNLTMTNVNSTTFLLQGPGGAVAGTITYDPATSIATFTPAANLAYGTVYTAVLKSQLQADNGLTLMPAQDYTWTFTTQPAVPNLSTSTKTNSVNGGVKPGDLVTYTLTLNNTGTANATVTVTDVLGSYYTVANLLDFTQPTTGTLTWTGVVNAGQSVNVQFVVQVKGPGALPLGLSLLMNSVQVSDGVAAPFSIDDPTPPMITIYGLYLPLITR